MATERIYIDLRKDVYDRLKSATELKSRTNDELTDIIVVTDSDQDTFETYFKDFISEFKNDTATFGRVKDYQGLLSYEMNESETSHGLKELKSMLERLATEYLLSRWYDDVGVDVLRNDALAKYENLLYNWRNHTAREVFITPKYRPYF